MREDSLKTALDDTILPFYFNRLDHGTFHGQDGLTLSYVRLAVPASRGALIILPGRTESHLKYAELMYDLSEAGFSIYALDHRGQGFSGRMLADPQKGYVKHFDDYVDDLEIFINNVVNASPHRKKFILAHSMGGTIAALHAAGRPDSVDGLILCSPMFKINISLMPRPAAYALANGMTWLGRGGDYVPGGAGYNPDSPFVGNDVTHSRARYTMSRELIRRHPAIALGSTTYQWVWESLKAARRASKKAEAIKIPALILEAGQDKVVSPEGLRDFCRRAEKCSLVRMEGSSHEILMELDEIRNRAINLILEFLSRNI